MKLRALVLWTIILCLANSVFGAGPVGGNIPALRPAYTADDLKQATLAYSYLTPGSYARWCTIQWEVEFGMNYAGIDKQLELCAQAQVTPLILLQPIHWTDPDRWVPPVASIPDKMRIMDMIVKRILEKSKALRLTPIFQLLNEPAGRCVNPPLSPKPGGSEVTTNGEWHPDLYVLMSAELDTLNANGIKAERIVSPAISCIFENNTRALVEMACYSKCDWNRIGIAAFNTGGSASWATDPNTRLQMCKSGFEHNAKTVQYVMDGLPMIKNKKKIVTEFYGTPAGFGYLKLDPDGSFNVDVTAICDIEVKAFQPIFDNIVVWGVRKGENDVPNNPWLYYGVWFDWMLLQKQTYLKTKKPGITGTGVLTATPVTGTATVDKAVDKKSGG